jgi:hypothetical protein
MTSSPVPKGAILAVAAVAALSIAACGSSNSPSSSSSSKTSASSSTSASASSSASATPGAAGGQSGDRVRGLVGSVSGGTVSLTGPNGPATVDVTPSTKVTTLTKGQLSDVAAGECMMVNPTKDGGTPPSVTAAAVLFGQADNGQCGHPGGGPGNRVGGTVASVNGNSIVLTGSDNAQITVAVTPDTRYAKRVTADTTAIVTGQCLAARGEKDASGAIQATDVMVRQSNNGQCGGRH